MISKNQLYDYNTRVDIFNTQVKFFEIGDTLHFLYNQDNPSIITNIKYKTVDKGIFGLERTFPIFDLNNSNKFEYYLFSLFRTLIKLERKEKIIKFYREN